jgi:hypothetical protein
MRSRKQMGMFGGLVMLCLDQDQSYTYLSSISDNEMNSCLISVTMLLNTNQCKILIRPSYRVMWLSLITSYCFLIFQMNAEWHALLLRISMTKMQMLSCHQRQGYRNKPYYTNCWSDPAGIVNLKWSIISASTFQRPSTADYYPVLMGMSFRIELAWAIWIALVFFTIDLKFSH